MNESEAFVIIDEIEDIMAKEINIAAMSPEVFRTLDNVDATQREIDNIEAKIGKDICLRLRAIANSVYSGSLRRGGIHSFYDAVCSLGMHRTKVLIIFLAWYNIGRHDPEVELIFARSYATSVLAGIRY